MKSLNKQQGSFIIELAFVLMFLCLLTLFTADIAMQLFARTKLDRVSYSLVNVLKERTRFYNGNRSINSDSQSLNAVAAKLLGNNEFGLVIDAFDGNEKLNINTIALPNNVTCKHSTFNKALIPVNSNDPNDTVRTPVYQVTLCEKYHSWFGKFTHGSTEFMIQSTSAMPGR
ncbi:tight adherence pilus pseudopilin TadF [Photobacterium leiognathi]|uniref:tight adherence pilus pseudopilin TadF n=1 Tax=Photobacterium leiognathi TaxID=553611 RepID=UPI002981790F|nr:tight adherence pilus pseudopilin TadF [Photobacterium leiognathi]